MLTGYRFFFSWMLVGSCVLQAQDSLVINQSYPSAFASYPDSLKVDSFFLSHSIDLRESNNPELYFEIYRWYRTCYHYGGNSSKGIDCSHFVNMLYENIYQRKLNNSAASIFSQCKVLKKGILQASEGDLLFFKIRKKRISHIAIYLQHGMFVHASTQSGVVISSIGEKYYKKRFYKVGRIE